MKYCEITDRTFWATRPYDIFPLVLTLEASAVACLCGFHASFFEWESHQRPGERQSHCMPVIANWELWLIVQKESLQNLHLKPYINGSEKAHIIPTVWPGEFMRRLFLRLEWVLICWKAALSKMWGTSFKLYIHQKNQDDLRPTQLIILPARNFHQELQLVCIEAHQSQIQAREQGRQCLCEDN